MTTRIQAGENRKYIHFSDDVNGKVLSNIAYTVDVDSRTLRKNNKMAKQNENNSSVSSNREHKNRRRATPELLSHFAKPKNVRVRCMCDNDDVASIWFPCSRLRWLPDVVNSFSRVHLMWCCFTFLLVVLIFLLLLCSDILDKHQDKYIINIRYGLHDAKLKMHCKHCDVYLCVQHKVDFGEAYKMSFTKEFRSARTKRRKRKRSKHEQQKQRTI